MLTKEYCLPVNMEPELYQVEKLTDTSTYRGELFLTYYTDKLALARSEESYAKSKYFPEIMAGFFSQEIGNVSGLIGWQVGVAVPLWIPANQSAIKQARIDTELAESEVEFQRQKISIEVENLLFDLNKYFRQIQHFQITALPQAEILLKTAENQLDAEEIDFGTYVQSVSLAFRLQQQYYKAVNNYNQTALQLEIYGN